ncbi:MAG: YbaB/EbfC family nucleoid-associated protein [Holosporaceae bacterium]|jgi:DNA-binding YbaB/EbfC family protein|nr:YbaB/EbfC family nucleoid-associated protein [Holosporaceae bacterium]
MSNNMNNINQLMKQAQQMQAKLMEAQNKMNELEITGTSGGGMVTVVISGKVEIKKLTIDPKLLHPDEAEIVSDLIVAAFNDAKSKLETKMSEQMGSFLPPGMKMP